MSVNKKRNQHQTIQKQRFAIGGNTVLPYFLRNPLALILSGLLALIFCIISFASAGQKPDSNLGVHEAQQRIIQNINEARSLHGNIRALNFDESLSAAAASKQSHMRTHDYWAHQAPDGTQPWEFIKKHHVRYNLASETLARGFSTPEGVVQGWLDSPGHRQTLLEQAYTRIGLSVIREKDGYQVVAFFIQPAASVAADGLVLSDTSTFQAQALVDISGLDMAKIAKYIPSPLVSGLLVVSIVSIVISVATFIRQSNTASRQAHYRSFHELPEVHLILHGGILLLLLSTTV